MLKCGITPRFGIALQQLDIRTCSTSFTLVTSSTYSAHFRFYYEIMEIRGFGCTALFHYTKKLAFNFVWPCSENSLWLSAVEFAVKSVQFGNISWLTFSVHFEDTLLRHSILFEVYSNLETSHSNSAWPMVLDEGMLKGIKSENSAVMLSIQVLL